MSTNGSDRPAELEDNAVTPELLNDKLNYLIVRMDQQAEHVEAMAKSAKEAANAAIQIAHARDPLTWQRRAWILAAASFFGSSVAGATVHTLWLAYLK